MAGCDIHATFSGLISSHEYLCCCAVCRRPFAPCRIQAPQAVASARRLWPGPKARHQQRQRRRRLGFSEFSLPLARSLSLAPSPSKFHPCPVRQCWANSKRELLVCRLLACAFHRRGRHRRHSMHYYPVRAAPPLAPSHTICSARLTRPSTLVRRRLRRLNELCVRTEGRLPLPDGVSANVKYKGKARRTGARFNWILKTILNIVLTFILSFAVLWDTL